MRLPNLRARAISSWRRGFGAWSQVGVSRSAPCRLLWAARQLIRRFRQFISSEGAGTLIVAPHWQEAEGLSGRRKRACAPPFQPCSADCAREKRMSIIGWIVLGLIAGFIASKIVNKRGEGFVLDVLLGIVGAVVG